MTTKDPFLDHLIATGQAQDPTGQEPVPESSQEQARHRPPYGQWPNDRSQSNKLWKRAELAKLDEQILALARTTHKGRPMSIAVRLGIDASYVRRVLDEHQG